MRSEAWWHGGANFGTASVMRRAPQKPRLAAALDVQLTLRLHVSTVLRTHHHERVTVTMNAGAQAQVAECTCVVVPDELDAEGLVLRCLDVLECRVACHA